MKLKILNGLISIFEKFVKTKKTTDTQPIKHHRKTAEPKQEKDNNIYPLW